MGAIYGDITVSAALRTSPPTFIPTSFYHSKVGFSGFLDGQSSFCEFRSRWSSVACKGHKVRCNSRDPFHSADEYELSSSSVGQETESFLLNAINMSFFERLNLAWKIIFPSRTSVRKSNANIAKQRLKMILFSDRCAVTEEAKQKIVSNVVTALSDFVEIESEDKVQLNVSTDRALGTVYSVTVPIRRVRPEFQVEDESGTITNVEYKDYDQSTGAADVKFDFYVAEENL